ncbi:MAG: hypothetical protein J0G95_10745 [Rhizobiales bacterium]|nr:hypothetical protein [Hyphomicrobiales bacterium]
MKLADLIPFRPRRTLSRYADDKAVKDFETVARDKGLLPKKSAFDVAMEDEARERDAYIAEIEKLTGKKPPIT